MGVKQREAITQKNAHKKESLLDKLSRMLQKRQRAKCINKSMMTDGLYEGQSLENISLNQMVNMLLHFTDRKALIRIRSILVSDAR